MNHLKIILMAAVIIGCSYPLYGADTGTVTGLPAVMALSPEKARIEKAAINIKTTVDKPKITIGDKVTLLVTINHNSKVDIKIPEIADSLGQFEIKDYAIKKPRKKWGKLIHEYKYIITTFTTGEYKIEPFAVQWLDNNSQLKEVQSGAITIFVESVKASAADKDDIMDLKQPVGIKHTFLYYFLLIGLPIILLGGFSVYYFTRKAKESGFFSGNEPLKPADELAYERIEKLKAMGLIEKGELKQYYIILSEIIRRYLEARYSIQVLDMTTYELYQQLRKIGADKKHTGIIKDFLEECDMVKFAKYLPEVKIIEEDTETAKKIVDVTAEEKIQVQANKI